jgi:hypothetical protein
MPLYAPAAAPAPLASGTYYYPISPLAVGTSSTLGVGFLHVTPWIVGQPTSIARLCAEVSGAGEAGSKVRLGLYADAGTNYPGALVVDGGTINGDSATVQEVTVAVTLAPGQYWLAAAVQVVVTTQPTVRTASGWLPPVPISAGTSLPAAAGTAGIGYSLSGVTGALPSTYTAGGTAGATKPRVFVRTA